MNFSGYTPVEEMVRIIPNGRYMARIADAKETQAGGYPCLKLQIAIAGHKDESPDTYTIFERPADQKKANVWDFQMTRFFDSFGIPRGNFDMRMWLGKSGLVDVYQRFDKKSGKSFAQLMPVRKDDPQTKDYLPQNGGQQGGNAPQPAQPPSSAHGADDSYGFPEDIPF